MEVWYNYVNYDVHSSSGRDMEVWYNYVNYDVHSSSGRDMEVWYNYDDNKEAWRAGSGGWQNVKLSCNARGGRPEPTIRYSIPIRLTIERLD